MAIAKGKKEAFTVDQEIDSMCSACDTVTKHIVRSVTKLGSITQAACLTCETASTFSRGVKTSVNMGKGKVAAPYDRNRAYKKGQAMMHDKFGHGEVTAVLDAHKIEVLFGDSTRKMLHAQEVQ